MLQQGRQILQYYTAYNFRYFTTQYTKRLRCHQSQKNIRLRRKKELEKNYLEIAIKPNFYRNFAFCVIILLNYFKFSLDL
jgi:hypothetical protein